MSESDDRWRSRVSSTFDQQGVASAVQDVRSQAEETIEGVEWDMDISADGLHIWIEGRQEDLKNFQTDIEDIWRGYGLQFQLDVGYEVKMETRAVLQVDIIKSQSN